ncbi:hypothetical protein PR003_g3721 [Phytophthora rubi]|uniref:Uncharacterized protein n=1 Tax=Phytophthora rubi TaxID=129364 RepID=A0A6A3GZF5_9STRA|nr:hypothetical protein PR002_g30556 [Phytophthora rubi]KAE8962314.1 hypothetical protein PR001_g29740 [Phytophthora rubi]KAE9353764.1 hypothetical protein PR003_g3721 [Phytophthora rubi]
MRAPSTSSHTSSFAPTSVFCVTVITSHSASPASTTSAFFSCVGRPEFPTPPPLGA